MRSSAYAAFAKVHTYRTTIAFGWQIDSGLEHVAQTVGQLSSGTSSRKSGDGCKKTSPKLCKVRIPTVAHRGLENNVPAALHELSHEACEN